MKHYRYKDVTITEHKLHSITCDSCGKVFHDPIMDAITSFSIDFGFGSKYDGETWCIDLCDDCIDKVFHDVKKEIKE